MKKVVKHNDLDRYYSKLKNLTSGDLGTKVVDLLVDRGVQEANVQYNETHFEVTSEKDEAKGTIIASGKGIAYDEYGTGLVGDGTYEGETPQSGVPITGKWDYYYDSPHKILGGWFFGKDYKSFTRGKVASMRMFNTAKSLREYVQSGELAKDIRSKQ